MNEELWDECVRFHGHSCPGLAMGFRAAGIAMEKLGISLPEDEIVCISENDACGVDAVQCMTSCTAGKGNLIFRITGKHAYSFFNRSTGAGVRVIMKAFKRPCPDEKEEFTNLILSAPADEIFDIKEPRHPIPEAARIYDSAVCDECEEPFREDLAVERDGKVLCVDCSHN